MFANNGLSLADIAAVTGNNRNNDDGFGSGNGWWILIILFAIFGGWGNGNNAGNNGGNCNSSRGETVVIPYPMSGYGMGYGGGWGAFDAAALQRGFDNQGVQNSLTAIQTGISSLGYDQLQQMNGITNTVMQTGFGLQNTIQQGNFGLQNAIQQNSVANMQGFNQLSAQQAECCCENRAAIAQVRYDMASDTCSIKNQMTQDTNAIIQNQNQNAQMLDRTIRDGFTALSMEAKDQRIAELERSLNASDRQNDLRSIASYIVDQVNPHTRPSYLTCNPNTGNVFPQAGLDQWTLSQLQAQQRGNCGCNTGCGSCC